MNFFTKLIIVALVILTLIAVKDKFYPDVFDNVFNGSNKNEQEEEIWQSEDEVAKEDIKPMPPEQEEKVTVTVYFTNTKSSDLKKAVRALPSGTSKINYAIKELIKGPTAAEKKQGFSSEIPSGVKILGIRDEGSLIVIDLSDEFQYGGGTESQYTRLNQLIKTVLSLNTGKPVYLYLNGKKAEVIGGEGLIITQPLSESSING